MNIAAPSLGFAHPKPHAVDPIDDDRGAPFDSLRRFGLPVFPMDEHASGFPEIGQRRAALADQTLHARDRLAPLGSDAAPGTKTKKITVVTTMVPITE